MAGLWPVIALSRLRRHVSVSAARRAAAVVVVVVRHLVARSSIRPVINITGIDCAGRRIV